MATTNETKHWDPHPPKVVVPADSAAITRWEDDDDSDNDSPPQRRSNTAMDVQLQVDTQSERRLRPGELLRGTRYRIRRWLGEGGMGTVFEAVHEDLERSAALKVLRKVGKERHVSLFRQEAKTLAKLGSQYVVEIYDFVELPSGQLAIAMELLRGRTLRDVANDGPMPLDRLIGILRQVCKGLSEAHRAGIIHRDIKPENISLELVQQRPDSVKLLDFGIAQVAGRTSGGGSRAGTPGYLAPEVVSGFRIDPRSDIYAVGCMAYELVAGRRPFEGRAPEKVLLAQVGEKPEPPSRHGPVPPRLERVILRCLEKEPEARYQTVDELEAAICEAQIALKITTAWDDLPLPDVPPDQRDRLLRSMPQPEARGGTAMASRVRWLAAGGLAVAIVLGAAWMMWTPVPTAQGQGRVETLSAAARGAAAKAFFVYPPPEQPDHPTAFSVVRELEAVVGDESDLATGAASDLRLEFADTLERLGDRYWQEEGGQAFALDYYAEALVFDPERARAKERAGLSPGELRLFSGKAASKTFTAAELEAVEPLIALADVTPQERDERLERLRASTTPTAVARTQRLAKVTSKPGGPTAAGQLDTTPAQPTAPTGPALEASVADGGDAIEVIEVTELDDPEPENTAVPDRAEARRLCEAAQKAHATGNSARAQTLFAEALQADARYAPAYEGLGNVAYDGGSYALAARMLKHAVRLSPRSAKLRIALGDAYFKAFDYNAAKAQYTRAAELGSPDANKRLEKVTAKAK